MAVDVTPGAQQTLVDLVSRHARARSGSPAFIVLGNGEDESARRTFAELDEHARRYAAWLLRNTHRGRPVLLLLRDPVQFIEAFLGCLCAGVLAVPIGFPRPNRLPPGIRAIAANVSAPAVLTTRGDVAPLADQIAEALPQLTWLYIEDCTGPAIDIDPPAPQDSAFIQYTSGSTGTPKGVVVSHRNLMSNEAAIQRAMRLGRDTRFVSWLPLFHDMGLIGNVLQPLYLGVSCVLMPPMAFLQRPLRWLRAVHRYRATITGGPNFAYDLCVERSTPAEREQLDLSSLTVAFSGSEPVLPETIERFAAAFAVSGFKRSSLYPCYGMAESTLIVTGVAPGSERVIEEADTSGSPATGTPARKRFTSCGAPVWQTEVVIVDPRSHVALPDGEIGEIWVKGPSVSLGYYNAPSESAATFGGRLKPDGTGPFLRTGDLGFMRERSLFVTGRLKDLIIVRGRNYYPQDLERTAGSASPWLEPGFGAAFLMDAQAGSVGIVHEVTRQGWHQAKASGATAHVIEAIAAEHGLRVERVLLIRPGTLPRTSSGKVRRSVCRDMLLAGAFEALPERVHREALNDSSNP